MKRLSLRARFLLVLIVLLAAVFAAITLVIVGENTRTLRANLVDQSKSFAALATQPIGGTFIIYQQSGTILIQQKVSSFTNLDHNINQVEIIDTNGQRLFSTDASNPITVSSTAASSVTPSYLHDKAGNLVGIVQPYLEGFGIHRYNVVYGISYTSVNRSIQDIVTVIIALSLGILLVSLLVWYVLINRLFLQPVANISRIALLISHGDLSRQIRLDRNDEIGDLADAVDTMTNSLKADITKLKQMDEMKSEFMVITSHNLRTPLTVIKAYMEQIYDSKPNTKLQTMLKPIEASVMRLGRLVEDVLIISTIEAGKNILHPEPTEMQLVLDAIAEEFAVVAKGKKQFTATIEVGNAWGDLSKAHFRSALWNLLDNAFKFTIEGGTIELTAHATKGQIEISVRDNGIGIATSEMPKLFTKFHRGSDIMAYNYEGIGIGLYIAKLIIGQHGGQITVDSIEGKGSTFTILLPTIPPPSAAPRRSAV